MNKIFFIILISLFSCNKESNNSSTNCGNYKLNSGEVKQTYSGSNGGCYYINSNGNKTYIDKIYCCNN